MSSTDVGAETTEMKTSDYGVQDTDTLRYASFICVSCPETLKPPGNLPFRGKSVQDTDVGGAGFPESTMRRAGIGWPSDEVFLESSGSGRFCRISPTDDMWS